MAEIFCQTKIGGKVFKVYAVAEDFSKHGALKKACMHAAINKSKMMEESCEDPDPAFLLNFQPIINIRLYKNTEVRSEPVITEKNDDCNGFKFERYGEALACQIDGLARLGPVHFLNISKRKFCRARIPYVSNKEHHGSFQLLLAGDVHKNPGPVRNPCSVCNKPVASTHRALSCDSCKKSCHIGKNCGNIKPDLYIQMKANRVQWSCPACVGLNQRVQEQPLAMQTNVETEANILEENDMFKVLNSNMGINGIKIAHLNVNGLLSKLRQIEMLLHYSKLDILALTETHLNWKTSDKEISVNGYQLERFDREKKSGGGSLLYYKSCLTVTPIKEINEVKEIESAWIELTLHSQKFLIGSVYRPPTDMAFIDNFSKILNYLWSKRKNILILGDFNSDLLSKDSSKQTTPTGKKLKQVLKAFNFHNLIKEPTRITESSETLIDLIVVSDNIRNSNRVTKSGTFEPAFSDHKLVYCVLNIQKIHSKPQLKYIKDRKRFNEEKFRETLDKVPWWVISSFEDIDDAVYCWETMYKDVLNEFISNRLAKTRQNNLPWVNREIKKAMNLRYKTLLKWQRNRSNNKLREEYKVLRNKINIMLRKAEAEYWKDQFNKSNSSREFWQIVNKMKGKSKTNNIQALKNDDGDLVTEDSEKAELLNNHFADVGKKLASNFSNQNDDNFIKHISRVTPTCESFKSDIVYLAHQVTTLNPHKSMGADEIAPREVKAANHSILEGLKIVIDKSFEDSKFPQAWKIAKLKSAFKKGSNVERENYRPLSLLSVPSKIQEGQICKTVDRHLDLHGATTPYQWGFKKGKSTEELLLLMTETWKKALDKARRGCCKRDPKRQKMEEATFESHNDHQTDLEIFLTSILSRIQKCISLDRNDDDDHQVNLN
eukprot:gene4136-4689_t